jgi:hypothetical protein
MDAIEAIAEAPVPVEGTEREVAVEVPADVPVEETASHLVVEEAERTQLSSEVEGVMAVIQAHSDGVRLVEIGNELGVDWRGLIAIVRSLMDEGKIGKIDNVYYPAQQWGEGER